MPLKYKIEVKNSKTFFREYKKQRKFEKEEQVMKKRWNLSYQVTRYYIVYVCPIRYFIVKWKYIITSWG